METEPKEPYREYSYRWVIVGLYFLNTMVGSVASGTVQPIATKLSQTYGVSTVLINAISMINLLAYAMMNFPANYFIDVKGIKVGVALFSRS